MRRGGRSLYYSICEVRTVVEGLGRHLWWSRPWRWECRSYIHEEVMRRVGRKEAVWLMYANGNGL